MPPDALDINVEGRRLAGPENGFGRLWRKRYRVRLSDPEVTPSKVIRVWKDHFGEFWPGGNEFYGSFTGLKPGEIALVDLEMPAGTRLSTGIIVVQADETSFTLMTPEGHTFAGQIAFSAFEEDNATNAQVEILMRASDPLFELGMPLGGHRREDQFWMDTLTALAEHLGETATPQKSAVCLDRRRKWRNVTNITKNAYLRTGAYMVTRPFRRLLGRLNNKGKQS